MEIPPFGWKTPARLTRAVSGQMFGGTPLRFASLGHAPSPLLGLSMRQIEGTLDQELERFRQSDPEIVRLLQIGTAATAKDPDLSIRLSGEQISVRYNRARIARLRRKLLWFKRPGRTKIHAAGMFSPRFIRELAWIIRAQLLLVRYLCEQQTDFVLSGNPRKLKAVMVKDVADVIGYHPSTISRILEGAIVALPSGAAMPARDLMPMVGRIRELIIFPIFDELARDPRYFSRGRWNVSGAHLRTAITDTIGLELPERALRHLRGIWTYRYLQQQESQQTQK